MQIAIFATINRPHAVEITRSTVAWLTQRGHQVRLTPSLALVTDNLRCAVPEEEVVHGVDFAISIGGDGTMLASVRIASPFRVPVLGVNAGALGFLTEVTPDQLIACLPRVLDGEYAVEERTMLRTMLMRDDGVIDESIALNEIVVRQGAQGRLINLDVYVAGHRLGYFGADGLILSSPTGSTAYGLSAGGPIVHPGTSVLLLVPICPHSLSFRPMVIPTTDPVEIICESNQHGDEMLVIADGQDPVTAQMGDKVIVRPADEPGRLIKLGLFSYYERLRDKLHWGGDNIKR